MRTVTAVVEEYIKKNPLLLNALSQRIVNMAALSRDLAHYVENELNQKVNQGSINMALVRLSRDLDFRANHKVIKLLKQVKHITYRYNLELYTFRKSEESFYLQKLLSQEMNQHPEDFYTFTDSVKETSLLISGMRSYLVSNLYRNEKIIRVKNKLSSITLTLPEHKINKANILCFIFQMLEWEGIEIHKINCTSHELSIVLEAEKLALANKVLHSITGKSIKELEAPYSI